MYRLLLLGADANKGTPDNLPLYPLIICWCTKSGIARSPPSARAAITELLMACGAKLTPFCISTMIVGFRGIVHEPDIHTLLSLVELCNQGPTSLRTMSACVVRKCLVAHELNGVVKNTDRLPLPSALRAAIKLEDIDIPADTADACHR